MSTWGWLGAGFTEEEEAHPQQGKWYTGGKGTRCILNTGGARSLASTQLCAADANAILNAMEATQVTERRAEAGWGTIRSSGECGKLEKTCPKGRQQRTLHSHLL